MANAKSSTSPMITGIAVPSSISDIAELHLHQSLLTILQNRGMISPIPLQKHLWPIIIRGRNVVCVSKSNTGKTLGYIVPLINSVIDNRQQKSKGEKSNEYGPSVLILVPSAEAATRIGKICSLLLLSSPGAKCVVLHSDTPECETYCRLLNGCSILVATPRELLKALNPPSKSETARFSFTNLRRLSTFVMDEAEILLTKTGEHIPDVLGEIRSALSSRNTEGGGGGDGGGSSSNFVQFIVAASKWTKEVGEFYESLISYQTILIKGADVTCEKKD